MVANPTYRASARVLRRTPDWTFIRRQLKWPVVGVRASKQRNSEMKKFVAMLIASAAMVATAYAGQIEGVVRAFDEATQTVTLEDGSAYVLAAGVKVEGLAAGAKVQVTFDDASKAATAVTVVQ
jgi:hypothetical protein